MKINSFFYLDTLEMADSYFCLLYNNQYHRYSSQVVVRYEPISLGVLSGISVPAFSVSSCAVNNPYYKKCIKALIK